MINFHLGSVLLRSVPELKHTARIGCDNSFGLSCGHGLHFLFEEMLGHLGMGDVVYPGAAAAAIRAVHLLELQSRNRFQQIPRLAAYALAVGKMAGVLISNSHLQGGEFTHKAEIAEKLRGVLDDRAESLRLLGVDRIVAQQMVVLFHGSATTGGVDDDGIDIGV